MRHHDRPVHFPNTTLSSDSSPPLSHCSPVYAAGTISVLGSVSADQAGQADVPENRISIDKRHMCDAERPLRAA